MKEVNWLILIATVCLLGIAIIGIIGNYKHKKEVE